MFLLVERPRGWGVFSPVRLAADNGHDAYEEAARRFANAVGYDLAMLYELGDDGVMRLRGRFERESAQTIDAEVPEPWSAGYNTDYAGAFPNE